MIECVVRMEMPTKDRTCQMADDIDGVWYCPVMKKLCRQPDNGDIPSWCPIICQLPEGHGPLKDADALIKRIETHKAVIEACTAEAMTETGKNIGTGAVKAFQISLLAINEIPTTVPAEAERSEHERPD